MNPLHFIVRATNGLASRWRNIWFRALGVRMDGYVWIKSIYIKRQWDDITLERGVMLERGVELLCSGKPKRSKLLIKAGTYVNCYTIFDAHERLEIGARCMIGPHCFLTDGNHGVARNVPVNRQPMESHPVIVEDEVWIGAGVCVLPGVRIGCGAVIGAGAVVTHDVAPFSVVAGVPSRLLKHRD
jgi:carbonic anhydrase/acetyltransferase-like protein (isoleucine patch superfamily)